MTTTDPTITIAGLRAERDTLLALLRAAIDDTAASVMARSSVAAERAGAAAERDAMDDLLSSVRAALARREAADLSRDASESVSADQFAILRADLASERAHLAACKQRIVAMEAAANKHRAEIDAAVGQLAAARQVIDENRAHAEGFARDLAIAIRERDEERATVARLTAERTEWISAAVAIGEHVDHLGPVASGGDDIATREWIHYAHSLAGRVKARIGALTARVAELEARPVLTVEMLDDAMSAVGYGASVLPGIPAQLMRHLGPVTLPTAQDRADELAAARWAAWRDEAGDTPTTPWDDLRDHRRDSEVRIMKRALRVVGAPPTSPPAARPVFAGVSASDLYVAYIGGQRECHQRHDGAIKDCCRYAAVAAVLARLEVSLVAPVDPEAVTAEYHDRRADLAPREFWPWRCVGDGNGRGESIAAMRATLTAAGIPVTPEVAK